MVSIKEISLKSTTVRVAHDLQRQILEMTSFLRVMNNYFKKKLELQNQLKPLILKKFEKQLKQFESKGDWLQNFPFALNTLSGDFLNQGDSIKFPNSMILFEAWMYLGIKALYPRIALQFKFPGLLKGEKFRNVFLFLFSTSRGFGLPIYFGPEFYEYKFKLAHVLDPLLRWSYTVFHRANQAIVLGDKQLKSKRHHPGEFESVIISEFENNIFKGIDTLLHGYFKNEAKILGEFISLNHVLQKSTFFYSIGDHAMRIEKGKSNEILLVPLITHEIIVRNYGIDFYSYIKTLLNVNKIIIRKINFYIEKKNNLISKLKKVDKLKFRMEQSKHFAKEIAKMSRKLSKKNPIIDIYSHYKILLEKIRLLLFTTPLYMHANHSTKDRTKFLKLLAIEGEKIDESKHEKRNSVLINFITNYEKKHSFKFEEDEVLNELENLSDKITKMWKSFKELHFKYAMEELNELSTYEIDDRNYKTKINRFLDNLLPIIAIYEIFNRSLFESVYPESIPQTKRLGTYFARFLASKYNPIGTNLMKLFNRLAYYNWIYLIKKKQMNLREFFHYLLKLPVWKYIPPKVKKQIIK